MFNYLDWNENTHQNVRKWHDDDGENGVKILCGDKPLSHSPL